MKGTQTQNEDPSGSADAPSASGHPPLHHHHHHHHDCSHGSNFGLDSQPIQTSLEDTAHDREHAASATPSTGSAEYHSLSFAFQTYLRNDSDERSHWEDVCQAYRHYAGFAVQQWMNQQCRIAALPPSQRAVLPLSLRGESSNFQQRKQAFKQAAIRNQFCLDCILRHAGQPHSQQQQSSESAATSKDHAGIVKGISQGHSSSTEGQISKVSSVLKSLARDWSEDGKVERDMAYIPIMNAVKKYIPRYRSTVDSSGHATTSPSRICVPGAGVGRLMCEISGLGYTVQGNEFSLYMLLASDFILNGPLKAEQPLQISPWLLETRNLHAAADQYRSVSIPDTNPHELVSLDSVSTTDPHGAFAPDFSMAAGEFVSIYGKPKERSAWDCVVACFFLDASPCIIEYLQVCYHMLRPEGFLISFGPLLWHWSGPAMADSTFQEYQERYKHLDPKYMQSVDFCWEDVKEILINIGFEIVDSNTDNKALYTADTKSMMNMQYRCVQFVARKKKRKKPSNRAPP